MVEDPSARERQIQDAAFRLVGEFMFHWSYIDSVITLGIQKLLKLPNPEGEIVLANVGFRDKTSMLATLAHEILIRQSDEIAKTALKLINEINEFNSNYRNILVHNPFEPQDDARGGVEIFRVRAKGKFEIPPTIWDADFFEARFREIDDFDKRLEALLDSLVAFKGSEDLMRAFIAHVERRPQPTESFSGPKRDDHLERHQPRSPHYPPPASTPTKDQEKPQNPARPSREE